MRGSTGRADDGPRCRWVGAGLAVAREIIVQVAMSVLDVLYIEVNDPGVTTARAAEGKAFDGDFFEDHGEPSPQIGGVSSIV